MARAGAEAGISTAKTRAKSARTALRKEARAKLNELVGTSEARKALVSHAESLAKQQLSFQDLGILSNLLSGNGMMYA